MSRIIFFLIAKNVKSNYMCVHSQDRGYEREGGKREGERERGVFEKI